METLYNLLNKYNVGNSLPTFREKPNGPIFKSQAVSSAKQSKTVRRLKMALISCPETSLRKYHSELRKSPKECISNLQGGGNLQSCFSFPFLYKQYTGQSG